MKSLTQNNTHSHLMLRNVLYKYVIVLSPSIHNIPIVNKASFNDWKVNLWRDYNLHFRGLFENLVISAGVLNFVLTINICVHFSIITSFLCVFSFLLFFLLFYFPRVKQSFELIRSLIQCPFHVSFLYRHKYRQTVRGNRIVFV